MDIRNKVRGNLDPESEWADLAARLRAVGLRRTPQRIGILAAFTPGEHVSADEIYARVDRLIPGLSRSTVYRALELFRDLGIITETDLGGDVRLYELLSDSRHHHLVCQACGATLELEDELVRPLREAIIVRHKFAARIDHLAVFGLCSACQARTSS